MPADRSPPPDPSPADDIDDADDDADDAELIQERAVHDLLARNRQDQRPVEVDAATEAVLRRRLCRPPDRS